MVKLKKDLKGVALIRLGRVGKSIMKEALQRLLFQKQLVVKAMRRLGGVFRRRLGNWFAGWKEAALMRTGTKVVLQRQAKAKKLARAIGRPLNRQLRSIKKASFKWKKGGNQMGNLARILEKGVRSWFSVWKSATDSKFNQDLLTKNYPYLPEDRVMTLATIGTIGEQRIAALVHTLFNKTLKTGFKAFIHYNRTLNKLKGIGKISNGKYKLLLCRTLSLWKCKVLDHRLKNATDRTEILMIKQTRARKMAHALNKPAKRQLKSSRKVALKGTKVKHHLRNLARIILQGTKLAFTYWKRVTDHSKISQDLLTKNYPYLPEERVTILATIGTIGENMIAVLFSTLLNKTLKIGFSMLVHNNKKLSKLKRISAISREKHRILLISWNKNSIQLKVTSLSYRHALTLVLPKTSTRALNSAFRSITAHSDQSPNSLVKPTRNILRNLVNVLNKTYFTSLNHSMLTLYINSVSHKITANNVLWKWKLANVESRYYVKSLRMPTKTREYALKIILRTFKKSLACNFSLWKYRSRWITESMLREYSDTLHRLFSLLSQSVNSSKVNAFHSIKQYLFTRNSTYKIASTLNSVINRQKSNVMASLSMWNKRQQEFEEILKEIEGKNSYLLKEYITLKLFFDENLAKTEKRNKEYPAISRKVKQLTISRLMRAISQPILSRQRQAFYPLYRH